MQEPAYPIFFPTYTPISTGYSRDWWWYDPEIAAEDIGPFSSRSEAVADWAWEHFSFQLIEEIQALDLALDSPMLLPPDKIHPNIHPVLPSFRRSLSSQQALTETGFQVLVQLEQDANMDLSYQTFPSTEQLQEVSA